MSADSRRIAPGARRLGIAVVAGLFAISGPSAAALAEPGTATAPDWVRAEQWHLQTLNVPGAWEYSDGAGVTVAVIDSGVDAQHPDLVGQVLPGLDLVSGDGDGQTDPVGHGTTVSAIIAGRNDDTNGVVGMAPKAKILPIRVLDSENRYNDALVVAKAVRWAVDKGAKVLNLSLGGSASSATLAAALDYAFAKDVVVIACTGNATASNTSNAGVWYPAREPGVLAVAGVERKGDKLWGGSITGKETVISAPATELLGARGPDTYWRVQGTSFAAPMVAATAALMRSRWPDMPAGEVVNRIVKTAQDRGAPGRDPEFGFGLVDPVAALTADVPLVLGNPLDNTPPQGVARFGNAPASGQAQSAPEESAQVGVAVEPPESNAGGWQAPVPPTPVGNSHARLIAVLLFLLSAVAAAVTIRRFARATG